MTIYEKLRAARKEKGCSQQEVADHLGVTRQCYSYYESGSRKIDFETAVRIGSFLNISLDELGHGSPTTHGQGDKRLFEHYPELMPIPQSRGIPVMKGAAAGKPIFREQEHISLPEGINADFCLECKGDSMINARIFDGDIVFVRSVSMPENGQIAVVLADSEVMLRRVYYYPEKNKLMLCPENPAYEPLVYMNDELDRVHILGQAVCFLSRVR